MITREDAPCWYELSWIPGPPPGILVRLRRELVNTIASLPLRAELITSYLKDFKFEGFCPDLRSGFGFDGSFRLRGERDGFVELFGELPVVEKFSGRSCGECGGTGEQAYRDMNFACLACDQSGKEKLYDQKPSHALSASFTLLFNLVMEGRELEMPSEPPQLLEVQTVTILASHGGSLSGMFSRAFTWWCAESYTPELAASVSTAMQTAWSSMIQVNNTLYSQHDFLVRLASRNGRLTMSCPGDACGIHPEHNDWNGDGGYRFGSHNVDNSMQQLTLLVGLAVLHDQARAALGRQ